MYALYIIYYILYIIYYILYIIYYMFLYYILYILLFSLLHYVILNYIILYYVILYYIIWCYIILYYIIWLEVVLSSIPILILRYCTCSWHSQMCPDGALCLAIIFLHLSGRFHLGQLLLLFNQVFQNEHLKDLKVKSSNQQLRVQPW